MKFPLLSVLLFIFFACNTVENASKESSFISQSQDTIQDSCCIYPVPQFPFEFVVKDSNHCISIDSFNGFAILRVKVSRRGKIKSIKLNRLDLYMPNDTISYDFFYCECSKYPFEIQKIYNVLKKYPKKHFAIKTIKKLKTSKKYYIFYIPIKIGCK